MINRNVPFALFELYFAYFGSEFLILSCLQEFVGMVFCLVWGFFFGFWGFFNGNLVSEHIF